MTSHAQIRPQGAEKQQSKVFVVVGGGGGGWYEWLLWQFDLIENWQLTIVNGNSAIGN